MEVLTSKQNPQVKLIRSLAAKKAREKEGLFVIEGIRFVEEALGYSPGIEKIVYSPKTLQNERGKKLIKLAAEKKINLLAVSEAVFDYLAETETPQGVLAVVKKFNYDFKNLILNGEKSFILVVDGVQDPGNLGTIIRTADAAGAAGIILTKGTADAFNSKVLRSTMGSIFRMPLIYEDSNERIINFCRVQKLRMIVSSLRAKDYLFDTDLKRPFALVIGSEASGVNENFIREADKTVKIPIAGRAESLNVAVATGILLYEALRQRLVNL